MLRDVILNDWYTIFILLSLLFITVSKLLFAKRFDDFLYIVANSNYLKIYARDQKFIDGFDAFLFAAWVISASVFGYYIFNSNIENPVFNLVFYLKLVFAIAAFTLIKILIERLIGSLFEIDKLIDTYLFQKTAYKNFIGLLLIPVNIIFIYSYKPSLIVIYVIIGVIILINLIGFITTFRNFQKLLISNFFYFILYLCALEIGPYIILYHLIKNYNI